MTRSGGEPLRVGALVSGGGRTVLNIAEHIAAGKLHARIEVVISSREAVPAVRRLREAGLRVEIVDRKSTGDPEFHERIAALLRAARVELVCMGGFFCHWRIPAEFQKRVINIHPALLPKYGGKGFYGDRVHRSVLEAGEADTGCTVHFADDLYDHGPIILQERIAVSPDDTVESLAARVFELEKALYPRVIQMFADGRLTLGEAD